MDYTLALLFPFVILIPLAYVIGSDVKTKGASRSLVMGTAIVIIIFWPLGIYIWGSIRGRARAIAVAPGGRQSWVDSKIAINMKPES